MFCSTSDILNDAVDVAEGHQKEAIGKAIAIAKKVSSIYNTEDLSPPAKYCMELYRLFMTLISPFIYPFQYSRAKLDSLHEQFPTNMKKFAGMLLHNTLGLLNTHPQSWYMHLLAFHALDLQLFFLEKFDRPLASFAMHQCEFSNKVRKEAMVSMYSFANRPVGNTKNPAAEWKNKNGYLMARRRISQLYYSYLLGRLRDPYQCSNCDEYGHNAGSKNCPVNIILNSDQTTNEIDELLSL